MIEVITNLFVGDDGDFEELEKSHVSRIGTDLPTGYWAVVHACKEPYHRKLLGYTSRGCPKDHPEYLWADRGDILYLNMVDAPRPEFFSKAMIDTALEFIDEKLSSGYKVLVHCNIGESRAPSLALLYMIENGDIIGSTIEDCEAEFLKIYPSYNPNDGIRGYLKQNFGEYTVIG